MGSLAQPRLNILTVGNMRVMICLGQGGLRSLSASSLRIFFAFFLNRQRCRMTETFAIGEAIPKMNISILYFEEQRLQNPTWNVCVMTSLSTTTTTTTTATTTATQGIETTFGMY